MYFQSRINGQATNLLQLDTKEEFQLAKDTICNNFMRIKENLIIAIYNYLHSCHSHFGLVILHSRKFEKNKGTK